MTTLRYAAYGSNLHPLRLRLRVPSARLLGAGHLAANGLHFHKRSADGSAKCGILEPGDGVHVAVYEMRARDKPVLDAIEGLGAGYDQLDVDVAGFGLCFSYAAMASHISDCLKPYDWYREMVLIGCRRHGFPQGYIAEIGRISVDRDPDAERSRKNWEIVELLRRDI